MNIMERLTPAKASPPTTLFTTRPELFRILREGRRSIVAELARHILEDAYFEGQRETTDEHVDTFAEHRRRNLWLDGSPIAFAKLNEQMFLVDGKHRVTSVLRSGMACDFNVTIHEVNSMEEVQSLYARYDQVRRARSKEQALNAFGLSDKLGVRKTVAKAVYEAIPIISNNMRPLTQSPEFREARILNKIVDRRLDAAMAFKSEAISYGNAVDDAPLAVKRKLLSPGVTAVGLVTFKHCPDRADDFWRSIAEDNGLSVGDPARALLYTLRNGRLDAGRIDIVAVPSIAWNAFYERRPLKVIKVPPGYSVKIAGTPLDGRRR